MTTLNPKIRSLVAPLALALIMSETAPVAGQSMDEHFAGFSAVNARTFVHVIIKRGSEFGISIYSDKEGQDQINTLELVQHGSTLVAGRLLDGKSLCNNGNVVIIGGIDGEVVIDGVTVPRYPKFEVHITTPDTSKIRRISASCFGRVTFHDADAKNMKLTASSSGHIQVAGDCTSSRMNASSSGEIHGRELLCRNISAYVSSSGRIEAAAVRGNVSAEGSSGGNIELMGTCGILNVEASSASEVDAHRMECRNGVLEVSSGAEIVARLTDTVEVYASSGGDIRVSGGAQVVASDESSGGRIRVDQ